MHHRSVRFRGQAGSGLREMAPLLLRNLGAKFSEKSFPKYKPALRKLAVVTFSQQIKTTDSNSVLNVLSPKCVARKKKSCVHSKSERSVLALKIGPFRCSKIQS